MNHEPWKSIFDKYKIYQHNFEKEPFYINAQKIKQATSHFKTTNEREVRVLCKQDSREDRPSVFVENNLFILPVKNGVYAIIKGEGYIDIPEIEKETKIYDYSLDFQLDTSLVGNSEMQHLDFAYASSLIRTFMKDPSLVLTIRGRKYTPKKGFDFMVGGNKIKVSSVQTEIDAGYEGRNQLVLIEAKNSKTKNTIIRQLYYPLRAWQVSTKKEIHTLFFEKQGEYYSIWEFIFEDVNDYNSIKLINSDKFIIRQ